ncbi:MAG: hypothetical protein LC749_07735 [Actinobacteria bacterium]|nr:hypothetical protein [Actinomycetota bacterium]
MTTTTKHSHRSRATDCAVRQGRLPTIHPHRSTTPRHRRRLPHPRRTHPTPTDINGGDPNAALHVIVEEWLWGNVTGWLDNTDTMHLALYRHHAMQWIGSYYGPTFPTLQA